MFKPPPSLLIGLIYIFCAEISTLASTWRCGTSSCGRSGRGRRRHIRHGSGGVTQGIGGMFGSAGALQVKQPPGYR